MLQIPRDRIYLTSSVFCLCLYSAQFFTAQEMTDLAQHVACDPLLRPHPWRLRSTSVAFVVLAPRVNLQSLCLSASGRLCRQGGGVGSFVLFYLRVFRDGFSKSNFGLKL